MPILTLRIQKAANRIVQVAIQAKKHKIEITIKKPVKKIFYELHQCKKLPQKVW
jgi:hypothetical protein